MGIFHLYCTAILIVFQLKQETEFKGINILVLAVEVTITFLETVFKSLHLGCSFAQFLEVDIEFVGFTSGLKFIVCCRQFFYGITPESSPIEHETQVTGLYLFIILLLLMGRPHRLIEILPFRDFEFKATALEYTVKMGKEIGQFKTFFSHFLRRGYEYFYSFHSLKVLTYLRLFQL